MIALLKRCAELHASDLHLLPNESPYFRIEGKLQCFDTDTVIGAQEIRTFLAYVLDETRYAHFEEEKELDFFYETPEAYFRINAYFAQENMACALRVIPREIPSMETLALPKSLHDLVLKKQGLVLVTGATGSGKSTTIAAMIEKINQTQQKHVITIEDPIEFVYTPKESIFSQRSVLRDTASFDDALKYALRQDPDVIVVGELRDAKSMRMAIDAALTGHLVFASLHTNSASGTLDRIVNSFDSGQAKMIQTALSQALLGVVSQSLVPSQNKRVGAYEVMLNTPAISNLIREGKMYQTNNTMALDRHSGMMLMDDVLFGMYQKNTITKQTALTYAHASDMLKKRIV